jgi:hypothetical protein
MGQLAWKKLFETDSVTVATGSSQNSKRIVYDIVKRPNLHGQFNQNIVLAFKSTVVSGSPTVKVDVIQSFDSLGEDDGFELISATLADGTVTKKNLYGDSRVMLNSYMIFKFTIAGTGSVILEGVCGQR